MKRKLVITAIVLQFFILLYMCGKRELIVRTGDVVYLRTAPVDPRDLFRGDFVRLNYELSAIPPGRQKIHDVEGLKKSTPLYAVLNRHNDGLAELLYITDVEPDDGRYIKGYPDSGSSFTKKSTLHVRYGIESYYVQQGKGIKMEERIGRSRWSKNAPEEQTPLEMRIALSGSGTAVITGHRWSPLGHSLKIEWKENRKTGRTRAMRAIFVLKNMSDSPLALIDLPGSGSFTLDPQGEDGIAVVSSQTGARSPSDNDVILLPPGGKHRFSLDLSNPRFFVTGEHGKRVPAHVREKERFRIVYRPPSAKRCNRLKLKEKIWHGYLPSSSFNSSGWID